MAIVGWNLVQTLHQDRIRAELDARAAAKDLALALRAALRNPALLELTPPETRFVVSDGAVQCDPEIGWVRAAPDPVPDAAVAERLRRAQIAEWKDGDATAARAHFDELLGPAGPDGERALPVVTAAAWQALRKGDHERVDGLLARLDAALDAMPTTATSSPTLGTVVTATALLTRARGLPAPAWRSRLLPTVDPKIAAPALARLAERGCDITTLQHELARNDTRRELLAAVTGLTPTQLPAAGTTTHGERLLLWFPDATAGNGRGALVPRTWLTTLRDMRAETAPKGLPPIPERGELVFGDPRAPRPHAEDVLPGIQVTAARLPEPPWFARPTAVLAAGLLLVVVFAASAFATMRGLRREALANRARADFLTGVTHELKTPIAAIRLVADVLGEDAVPEARQREYFALLRGESARLSMLIDNVLDLGQMERGERAYDLRDDDLAEAVREAVALFTPLAQQVDLTTTVHTEPPTLPALFDRGALVQSLLSVFENARKYAAAGRRLDVTLRVDGDRATIVVRDFGAGVPADEREAIFARFARGSAHRHRSVPGLGLGLHLARAVVQRHGGSLLCTAPPEGPGAAFVFSLPLPPRSSP